MPAGKWVVEGKVVSVKQWRKIRRFIGVKPLEKIKRLVGGNYEETIEDLRKRGVKIGENVHIFSTSIDDGHGFLVEIGNNVTMTNATILTHDASTKKFLGYSKVGKVKIGDNVFVGYGSIVLPGVIVGNNVIIGGGGCCKG